MNSPFAMCHMCLQARENHFQELFVYGQNLILPEVHSKKFSRAFFKYSYKDYVEINAENTK